MVEEILVLFIISPLEKVLQFYLQVVMLALGPKKSAAVAAMVEGPVSERCPASALQMHPATTLVLDPEAAQLLKF